MTRIIEKIIARRKKQRRNQSQNNSPDSKLISQEGWYYSFEFFPPKTEAGLDNLLTRIDRMSNRMDPLFIDVTWGDSGSTSAQSMSLASHAQRYCGIDVLLHISCTGMTQDQLVAVLRQAKSCGVQNILALRGDPPRGKSSWGKGDVSGGECDRAIDLVKLIRNSHGSHFGIAVAGHPEGHPASIGWEEEMKDLKDKVDAGADFIITQLFYDASIFLTYVRRCRQAGILCPILPGIMPIQNYSSFIRMTRYCNISVPPEVLQRLEPVKDDDEAVKEIGCEIASDMSRKILNASEEEGGVDGIHFYTLNLERSVTRILMSMGAFGQALSSTTEEKESNDNISAHGNDAESSLALLQSSSLVPLSQRKFPWKPSAMQSRVKEDVRPINWANRPKSYVMRTEDWDEFPNGRWGDSSSPAFGELSNLSHFYSFSLGSQDDRRAMLGCKPTEVQHIYDIFARYVEGELPHLPWCETVLQPESLTIQRQLASLNRHGFLTVNSQPPVNGVQSTHSTFGWGGNDGYVYQKAYCECFVSPKNAQKLLSMVKNNPSMNLYAVNNSAEELRVGIEEGTTALTWGVFPCREILQPTVFDPSTFLVWAEEAFSLWTTMWLDLYEMDSKSYELIETVRDTYFLVAIIDNNFTSTGNTGSLWEALLEVGCVK